MVRSHLFLFRERKCENDNPSLNQPAAQKERKKKTKPTHPKDPRPRTCISKFHRAPVCAARLGRWGMRRRRNVNVEDIAAAAAADGMPSDSMFVVALKLQR
jgi:hypothetical protein